MIRESTALGAVLLVTRREEVSKETTMMSDIMSTSVAKVPTSQDIALISQLVALKWRLVGLDLGIHPSELDQIASECGSDQSLCSSKLFRKWSAREITASCPFTWEEVAKILDSYS